LSLFARGHFRLGNGALSLAIAVLGFVAMQVAP